MNIEQELALVIWLSSTNSRVLVFWQKALQYASVFQQLCNGLVCRCFVLLCWYQVAIIMLVLIVFIFDDDDDDVLVVVWQLCNEWVGLEWQRETHRDDRPSRVVLDSTWWEQRRSAGRRGTLQIWHWQWRRSTLLVSPLSYTCYIQQWFNIAGQRGSHGDTIGMVLDTDVKRSLKIRSLVYGVQIHFSSILYSTQCDSHSGTCIW